MHQNKAVSKWSSECLFVTEDLWNSVYDKAFNAVNFIELVSVYSYLGATCVQRSPR